MGPGEQIGRNTSGVASFEAAFTELVAAERQSFEGAREAALREVAFERMSKMLGFFLVGQPKYSQFDAQVGEQLAEFRAISEPGAERGLRRVSVAELFVKVDKERQRLHAHLPRSNHQYAPKAILRDLVLDFRNHTVVYASSGTLIKDKRNIGSWHLTSHRLPFPDPMSSEADGSLCVYRGSDYEFEMASIPPVQDWRQTRVLERLMECAPLLTPKTIQTVEIHPRIVRPRLS